MKTLDFAPFSASKLVALTVPALVSRPVVGHLDPASIFTSSDPKLNADKQAGRL